MCYIILIAILIIGIILLRYILKRNKKETFEETEEFKKLSTEIINSGDNFFITGKAGTGKSRFISYLIDKKRKIKKTNKSTIRLAPTGIAALNIKGQTIHSFFKFPIITGKTIILGKQNTKGSIMRKEFLENIDMIIIDEISMVSSNMLHAIDYVLQTGMDNNKRFGGIQIILIGDFHQLPPIIKGQDAIEKDKIENEFKDKYGSPFFFNAFSKDYTKFVYDKDRNCEGFKIRELTRNFRQVKDNEYLEMIDKIRNRNLTYMDYDRLNININKSNIIKNAIFLVTRNKTAFEINIEKLNALKEKTEYYTGDIKYYCEDNRKKELEKLMETAAGFENFWGTSKTIALKKYARVMMIINDPSGRGRYQNGTRGIITKLSRQSITVKIERLEGSKEIQIGKEYFEHYVERFNEKTGKNEIHKEVEFHQFPLKLAWAITIHKSQGLTFNEANINLETGSFCCGQSYVAFSRIGSFSGLNLTKEVNYRLLFSSRKDELSKDKFIFDFEKYIEGIKTIN